MFNEELMYELETPTQTPSRQQRPHVGNKRALAVSALHIFFLPLAIQVQSDTDMKYVPNKLRVVLFKTQNTGRDLIQRESHHFVQCCSSSIVEGM